MSGPVDIDLATQPPPDLAIEVEVTHPADKAMRDLRPARRARGLAIRRPADGRSRFLVLGEDGVVSAGSSEPEPARARAGGRPRVSCGSPRRSGRSPDGTPSSPNGSGRRSCPGWPRADRDGRPIAARARRPARGPAPPRQARARARRAAALGVEGAARPPVGRRPAVDGVRSTWFLGFAGRRRRLLRPIRLRPRTRGGPRSAARSCSASSRGDRRSSSRSATCIDLARALGRPSSAAQVYALTDRRAIVWMPGGELGGGRGPHVPPRARSRASDPPDPVSRRLGRRRLDSRPTLSAPRPASRGSPTSAGSRTGPAVPGRPRARLRPHRIRSPTSTSDPERHDHERRQPSQHLPEAAQRGLARRGRQGGGLGARRSTSTRCST